MSSIKSTQLVSEDWEELDKKLLEPLPEQLLTLLEKAKQNEKWPVAQLISIFERNTTESFIARHQLVSYMNRSESVV